MRRKIAFIAGFAVLTMWLASVSAAQDAAHREDQGENDWIVLFDGSSLDQWRGYQREEIGRGWRIDDDALMFDGTGGGDIVTREEFGDFDLRFEWKVAPGANSGVMYRVRLGDQATYLSGPEYQILDDERHRDGLDPRTGAASLYGLYAPEDKELKDAGEWNTGRIVLRGNHIEHWLNGKKVLEAEIGSDDWNQRVERSKFREWSQFAASRQGHIALQDHGDQVWYRNIRIQRLDNGDE